jgi:hypothetical protein
VVRAFYAAAILATLGVGVAVFSGYVLHSPSAVVVGGAFAGAGLVVASGAILLKWSEVSGALRIVGPLIFIFAVAFLGLCARLGWKYAG